jgi:hypothetical protein
MLIIVKNKNIYFQYIKAFSWLFVIFFTKNNELSTWPSPSLITNLKKVKKREQIPNDGVFPHNKDVIMTNKFEIIF